MNKTSIVTFLFSIIMTFNVDAGIGDLLPFPDTKEKEVPKECKKYLKEMMELFALANESGFLGAAIIEELNKTRQKLQKCIAEYTKLDDIVPPIYAQ